MELQEHNDGVKITRNNGDVINLSYSELWEICRYGRFIDARSEVEEYLDDCDAIYGVKADAILCDMKLLDDITDEVISMRIGYESGDDIWEAASKLIERGSRYE